MKKLSKFIITCIVFLNITTAVFATNILPENKFCIKKVAILSAGVFLVVQILFIAYQKDKIQENIIFKLQEENIEKNKEVNLEIFPVEKIYQNEKLEEVDKLQNNKEIIEIKKEEEYLFTPIVAEPQIETLPDKMTPKKKNIILKKDVVLVEKKISHINRPPKGSVKIVRERKKRNFTKQKLITNNDDKKENLNRELKNEEFKNAIQLAKEVKEKMKNEVIETKQRNKNVGKEAKKKTKKL